MNCPPSKRPMKCEVLLCVLCLQLVQVEEDVLLKSGEIRVLRDSLRAAQQEVEAQRLKQVQVLTQQQQQQSSREKELLKKVQSLESELQFKGAEINDMRTPTDSITLITHVLRLKRSDRDRCD
uniref:Uncharacterized protein n=1 Tax=Neogobius melanostomus TaxID=47308 RepID=A0A8C6UB38_9GOBI